MVKLVQICQYGKIPQEGVQFNLILLEEIASQPFLQLQEKLKNVYPWKSLMIVYFQPGKTSKILMMARSVLNSHFGKILLLKKELLLG